MTFGIELAFPEFIEKSTKYPTNYSEDIFSEHVFSKVPLPTSYWQKGSQYCVFAYDRRIDPHKGL